jgi:hypothetical protein
MNNTDESPCNGGEPGQAFLQEFGSELVVKLARSHSACEAKAFPSIQ